MVVIGYSLGAVLDGIESTVVTVEADVSSGLPTFSIVGLPDSAVNESRLRIRSAVKSSGFVFPQKRITVNLSPASLRKRGAGLDLAIAIAILRADGQLPNDYTTSMGFSAELSLSGALIPAGTAVSLGLAFLRQHIQCAYISASEDTSHTLVSGLCWHRVHSLQSLGALLRSVHAPEDSPVTDGGIAQWQMSHDLADMREIQGLQAAKRALTISAAGEHPILLVGPPGCGKTMMAERFNTILPRLTEAQALDVYAIHQACGLTSSPSLVPPLRAPHHSITAAGLIGGGSPPMPGEVTLAHHGVLLLDELLEFGHPVLETLREPLSNGSVQLTRGSRTVRYPAKFLFIATCNPCPCGRLGSGECVCRESDIANYWKKLSGPLADRLHMLVRIQPTVYGDSSHQPSSSELRDIVEGARLQITDIRKRAESGYMDPDTSRARQTLIRAARALAISHRGACALWEMAETIAGLDSAPAVRSRHVEEALMLRNLDGLPGR